MVKIQVEEGFRLTLPKEARTNLNVGDELIAIMDKPGQVILISASKVQEILQETFGLWANRTDIPQDGIEYMDEIRKGTRLDEINRY